ncbi:type II/IV secretion system protein [Candidatus Gracilibacteria bacterium]|nr:type II/IV secretion system protein [Candidatus Gracilibacteria bacterium]
MEIKNEEEFKKVKGSLMKEDIIFKSEKFENLGSEVKDILNKSQNSDNALIIITKGALSFGGSDVHYDIQNENNVQVRFRIDGLLTNIFTLNKAEYKLILERLKYKSDLKLNITDIPQDGKYKIIDEEGRIDVRISTLPVKFGENVVCRILDSTNSIPKINELGLMWTSKHLIDKSLNKKNGMILVTGPTGSGKTTTLYSMLNILNTTEKKIITLEDPIEYELPQVVQSEVNEKKGYTYTTGLKALLRQDPDVVMVGEIRDFETAQIAAQASLTGHLVLTTIHTKSASETIERLINIGVAPYILSSSIDIIIAQRLVRKICTNCIESAEATNEQNDIIKWMMKDIGIEAVTKAKKDGFKLYYGKGCEHCGYSGFKGRIGIYEVLSFNEKVRELIRSGASPEEILAEARNQDFILMREDGVLKAMRGKTTIEELFKVID